MRRRYLKIAAITMVIAIGLPFLAVAIRLGSDLITASFIASAICLAVVVYFIARARQHPPT